MTFYTVKGFLANQTVESILDFFLWRCRRYSTLKIIFEIEFFGEGSVMANLGLKQVKGEFRSVITFFGVFFGPGIYSSSSICFDLLGFVLWEIFEGSDVTFWRAIGSGDRLTG